MAKKCYTDKCSICGKCNPRGYSSIHLVCNVCEAKIKQENKKVK